MGQCHCSEANFENKNRNTGDGNNNKKLNNYTSDVEDFLGNERTFYSFDKSKKSACDFKIVKKIGQGNFGTVYHVYCEADKKDYAMKIIHKNRIRDEKQKQHALNEKNILASNNHPFLLKLYYSFQDDQKLYLITEYVQGGDLYMNMKYKQKFTDREVLFYCSEIIVALEYLHSKGIIYRDLKPENVLLTKQGHIKLADFGLSKIKNYKDERSQSKCGTPDYIAPEIVLGQNGHDESCDFWSLGSVIYELYHGYPPFFCKDKQKQIIDSMNKEVLISKKLSEEAQDLIRKFLQPNPENRIGSQGGFQEIKSHPFFKNIDWVKVNNLEIDPIKPIRPETINKEIDSLNGKKNYPSCEIDINQNHEQQQQYAVGSVLDYTFNYNQNFVQLPDQAARSQFSSKTTNDNVENVYILDGHLDGHQNSVQQQDPQVYAKGV
ncbi:Serine/Threonine kinase domain protein (macronuclear) [Tetrahymena thermophila SB210]|uniref:Serine/Threonine kinase domain protein n=1 Tax=Tetrahymena thermophila (strain SB210) TaxID=312017 RepID=Q24JF9_TETTS|nr:Serine/Threonine kinase domain protein [Tetrahymena thermophila SB210]EAS07917.2 Serine/Threonine kinase domain protein [Tetrahymena thermophila SB210]|eukprot:XP_001028159.2 Serine/Threonine kinase domain protein [Tetrahymena thermophila SB210]